VPELKRADGVEVHWEERGDGPTVFFAHISWLTMPSRFEALLTDLATDHRVLTWDPRGVGQSTRRGPYDIATDAEDMAALVEAISSSVVIVSADPASIKLTAERPELIEAVVLLGLGPLGEGETDSLLDSESVIEAALQLARSDYRAFLRAAVTAANPQASEEEVRERVEAQVAYCPQDVALPHIEEWSSGETISRTGPALGGRLWIVQHEDPLVPAAALDRARELLPEAHFVEAVDGPISRPDIVAGVVRKITAPLRASQSRRESPRSR
jgi:pimeloyl-ACP methyl ester carboxylesterase